MSRRYYIQLIQLHFHVRQEYKNDHNTQNHRSFLFFSGYLQNLYLNDICYACPFCSIPRTSDITLGDYWGVPGNLFDDKGVSVVLANTEKGESVLKKLKHSQKIDLVPVVFKNSVRSNPRIVDGNFSIPKVRDFIFEEIGCECTFQLLHEKYIRVPSRFRHLAGRAVRMPLNILKHLFSN